MIFAIALAIAGVAIVVYRGVETSRQRTAGASLTKAEDLAALQSVVLNHPKTLAAGSAMVLLADSQWAAGKGDEAVATLEKFIRESPAHPAILTAKASLGSKLMTQGKTGDAAKIFEALASDPEASFIAPFALISLGDIAKNAGDLAKAEASYNRVKTDFADSSFAETANRRTATLKTKAPTEIEPPPAPPKSPTPSSTSPDLAPASPTSKPVQPPAKTAPVK